MELSLLPLRGVIISGSFSKERWPPRAIAFHWKCAILALTGQPLHSGALSPCQIMSLLATAIMGQLKELEER